MVIPSERPRRAIELVLFDMDGVIFEGRNFWLDLHRLYDTEEVGVALAERYMGTDYGRLANIVAGKLWRGRPAGPFETLVAEREYQPGIEALFGYLQAEELATAVITSGPEQLAERAQRDLGIDMIRANRVQVTNGRIAGEVTINVPDAEKVRVGLEVMAAFDVVPERTVFIGDSDSDASLAELVGLAIAYDSDSPSLEAVSDHVIPHGDLLEVTEILAGRPVADQSRHEAL